MRFEEYERQHFGRYQAFSDVVRIILNSAISAAGHLPVPQSIQARAKTPTSLKKRLKESGQLDAEVNVVRRDLAGVRLIFYTNNDVERFLSSSIVFDNFEVDRNATKIHHPSSENGQLQYRAVHYTVSLSEARTALPEYADFAGMRCEIQIQTILIHAWAETSHDIIYKVDDRQGFGNSAMEQIKKRFNRIMNKYLVPAGYEFQRVQQDYERLIAGRTLLDQNLLQSLKASQDNNERYDLLASLADDMLPLYDDIPSVIHEVLGIVADCVVASRSTPTMTTDTSFWRREGRTCVEITKQALELISRYKHHGVVESFDALRRIFVGEEDEGNRKRLLEIVADLAGYSLEAWKQVGPAVQGHFADVVEAPGGNVVELRPFNIVVWKSILSVEATGQTWSADALTLEFGQVPPAEVHELRTRAMLAVFDMFRTAVDDVERRDIVHALQNATQATMRSEPSRDLLRESLTFNTHVAEFYTTEASSISYELRETIENIALHDYHGAVELIRTDGAAPDCLQKATEAVAAIRAMRDSFNEDLMFVRYKVLVGFEGVMSPQWDDPDFGFEKVDRYRREAVNDFVGEINDDNKADWLPFIERCAATKSNDLATFPMMGEFIRSLSEQKPGIADFLLSQASDDLLNFSPGFLNGLYRSSDRELYRKNLLELLEIPSQLFAIATHWQAMDPDDPESLTALLLQAAKFDQRPAIAQCLVYAMNKSSIGVPPTSEFARLALQYLVVVKDPRWINLAFFNEKPPFFVDMDPVDVGLILDNLLELPEIQFNAERILSYLCDDHGASVWDFFGRRLQRAIKSGDVTSYRATPWRFRDLLPSLSADATLAVSKARAWYDEDPKLFGYRGGRVLSAVYPNFPEPFATILVDLVRTGTSTDVEFVLDVMPNYGGRTMVHTVLREAVARFAADEALMTKVRRGLHGTSVITTGETGRLDLLRSKKVSLTFWLDDASAAVKTFAEAMIANLDLEILQEQRRVDEEIAMRKLAYDIPDEPEE